MVGLDALPTYKRVVAWFLGPVEDTGRYFWWLHRVNQDLDTSHWRVYEHKEGPPCAWYRHYVYHNAGEDGMETSQWHRTGSLLLYGC